MLRRKPHLYNAVKPSFLMTSRKARVYPCAYLGLMWLSVAMRARMRSKG